MCVIIIIRNSVTSTILLTQCTQLTCLYRTVNSNLLLINGQVFRLSVIWLITIHLLTVMLKMYYLINSGNWLSIIKLNTNNIQLLVNCYWRSCNYNLYGVTHLTVLRWMGLNAGWVKCLPTVFQIQQTVFWRTLDVLTWLLGSL